MNDIKIFENEEFGKIRTAGTADNPLFCLVDVAKALKYSNPAKAVIDHCKGVTVLETPTNGGVQKIKFGNEGQLYRLILRAKTEEAEKFQDWVTDIVLPSIRKTGQYGTFHVPQTFSEALMLAAKQQQKIEQQQKTIEAHETEILALSDKVSEMQPKAAYYDQILSSQNTVVVTQIAKDYGYSAVKFNKLLENLHIQYRMRGQWVLYAEHAGKGYTKSISVSFDYRDGSCGTRMQTEWTQKGRLFLYDKLKENDILPTIEK